VSAQQQVQAARARGRRTTPAVETALHDWQCPDQLDLFTADEDQAGLDRTGEERLCPTT
jgi:hypothetical protein